MKQGLVVSVRQFTKELQKNRRFEINNTVITDREVSKEKKILYGSCEAIITNIMNMKRGASEFVQKMLNFGETQHREAIFLA